jgi:putative ABC transport system permease protein
MKTLINMLHRVFSARGHLATATICIALGIASVMIIINSITEYIRPVSPESNVARIMCSHRWVSKDKKQDSRNMGAIPLSFAQAYLSALKTPESTSIFTDNTFPRVNGTKTETFKAICCDASYWHIFDFQFVDGRPFSSDEFAAKVNVAVVSRSFFDQLSALEKKLRRFAYMDKEYSIVGVVDNVRSQRIFTSAHIWIPYSTQFSTIGEKGMGGQFKVVYLLRSEDDRQQLLSEVKAVEQRYNSTSANPDIVSGFTPHSKLDMLIRGYSTNTDDDVGNSFYLRWLAIAAIILLVPILNLIILNYSHIKDRYVEMGVRKSFGATQHSIASLFLKENTVVVLIGGAVGYVLSFLLGLIHHINLFDTERYADMPIDNVIHPNWLSFIVVLVICLLASLLSGIFPSWKLAKMNINSVLKGGAQ